MTLSGGRLTERRSGSGRRGRAGICVLGGSERDNRQPIAMLMDMNVNGATGGWGLAGALFVMACSQHSTPVSGAENDGGVRRYATTEEYLAAVYPGRSRDVDFHSLAFFYDSVPASHFPDLPDFRKYEGGPPLGVPWETFYQMPGTFRINQYDPTDWNNFPDRFGFRDHEWVEVTHECCDTTHTGYWMYHNKGSGLFYNLGRTIAGTNKIDVLRKLGFTYSQIADELPGLMFWTADSRNITWQELAESKGVPDLPTLLEIADIGTDYEINRLGNSGEFDALMNGSAQAQGYDTVQATVQPNGAGGWAFEIIGVRVLGADQSCSPTDQVMLIGEELCTCQNVGAKCLYCAGQESEAFCQ